VQLRGWRQCPQVATGNIAARQGKKSCMVAVVICGRGLDAQRGGGICIPGVVKTHLKKTMSKMTPTLKLSLL